MSIIAIGIMQMEPDDKQTYIRDLVPTPTHNKLVVQVAEAIAVYGFGGSRPLHCQRRSRWHTSWSGLILISLPGYIVSCVCGLSMPARTSTSSLTFLDENGTHEVTDRVTLCGL